MITDRDINILKFLNDFGFARSFVVEEVFFSDRSLRGKKQMCHRRLKLMEEEGLVKSERVILPLRKMSRLKKNLNRLCHQIFPFIKLIFPR